MSVTGKLFQSYSNKHSSLVQKLVNYSRKKFYRICPWRQAIPNASVGANFIWFTFVTSFGRFHGARATKPFNQRYKLCILMFMCCSKESSVKTCFQNKSNFATEDSFEHYNEIKFNQMKLYTTDNEGTSLTKCGSWMESTGLR